MLEQRLEQLEQEREELDRLLEDRDAELGAMKDSVAALNAESMRFPATSAAVDLTISRKTSDSLQGLRSFATTPIGIA